jgi:hypothetical protein
MKRTVVGLILFAFLAVPAMAQEEKWMIEHKKNKQMGEPADDMALVYVLRPSSLGAAIRFWVFADEQVLGLTRGKGYMFALVPEGEHLFWAKAENTSTLEMEVVGGRTYYLKVAARMGWGKARVRLAATDEAEAEKVFKKAPYVELTEAGLTRGKEIVANRLERAKTKEGKKEKWDEEEE